MTDTTAPPVPHTITLQLEDGQPAIKGRALVALADASDATVAAVVDVLAARQAVEFDDAADLVRIVDHAANRILDAAYPAADDIAGNARTNLATAAALLLAAIETIDHQPSAEPVPPTVGYLAWHKTMGLDPRPVTRVEGDQIWIDIIGTEGGPYPADHYTYTAPTSAGGQH